MFLKTITAALAAVCLAEARSAAEQPAPAQPNILWVISDDQRMDSIAAFNRMTRGAPESALGPVLSPYVDGLTERGVTFINTFNQNPSCAPSRAVMHTGRYSHRSGVYGFETHVPRGMDHWRPLVPEVLVQDAGYQTVSVGKRGLRYEEPSAKRRGPATIYQLDLGYRREFAAHGLFDWNPSVRNKDRSRDELFQFPDGEVLKWPADPTKDPADLAELQKRMEIFRAYPSGERDPGKSILAGVNSQTGDQTRDGLFVRELARYLENAGREYTSLKGETLTGPDPQRPLFAHCGFDAPHTPVLPPESFRARFRGVTYEVPEVSEAEIAAFPPQIRKLYRNSRSDHYTDEEKQAMIADYYAFCAFADDLVRQAVDAFVDYSEKADRPWMVLYVCGDHGWRLNEHGMISKFGPWDVDLRDPVVVVSSDQNAFPPGRVVEDFTQFVDMAPTFFAAAGLDLADPAYDHLDGVDLAAVVRGDAAKRDYVIAEPTPVTGPRAVIRTRDYKFAMKIRPKKIDLKDLRWAVEADYADIEPMFYDLRADPGEVDNRAFDARYRPVIDALRKKLQDVVLGDGRIEVDWAQRDAPAFVVSDFAPGADDGRLVLPEVAPAR